MVISILKKKFKKMYVNNSKSKTEKFKILISLIDKIQKLIIDSSNIKAEILMPINSKSQVELINQDNLLKLNISNLYKKLTSLIIFLNNNLSKYQTENY